jgi:hypothetical protein
MSTAARPILSGLGLLAGTFPAGGITQAPIFDPADNWEGVYPEYEVWLREKHPAIAAFADASEANDLALGNFINNTYGVDAEGNRTIGDGSGPRSTSAFFAAVDQFVTTPSAAQVAAPVATDAHGFVGDPHAMDDAPVGATLTVTDAGATIQHPDSPVATLLPEGDPAHNLPVGVKAVVIDQSGRVAASVPPTAVPGGKANEPWIEREWDSFRHMMADFYHWTRKKIGLKA